MGASVNKSGYLVAVNADDEVGADDVSYVFRSCIRRIRRCIRRLRRIRCCIRRSPYIVVRR